MNNLVTRLTEEKGEEKRTFGNIGTQLNRCWYHGTEGHDILDCVTFQEILKKRGSCFNCLRGFMYLGDALRNQDVLQLMQITKIVGSSEAAPQESP